MAAYIERLNDERILLLTYTGHVTIDEQQMAFERSLELMGDTPGIFYRIADTRTAYSTVNHMVKMIQNASEGKSGSTTDKRIRVVMVGTGHMEMIFIEAMESEQFGGLTLPFFYELDDALVFAREQLALLDASTDG